MFLFYNKQYIKDTIAKNMLKRYIKSFLSSKIAKELFFFQGKVPLKPSDHIELATITNK